MEQKMVSMFVCSLVLAFVGLELVYASDPELTTDFAVPPGLTASNLNGSFFTFTGLRSVTPKPGSFATVSPANLASGFAALEGLGVSVALIQYPPNTINPLHTHPRGTEILFIIEGTLDVGLIDSTNKLYTQTLQTGDVFVFPKGLVHFQINWGKDPSYPTVKALAGFSSSNAGLIVLPKNLFGSEINANILAQSFGVSTSVIGSLTQAQS